jgi:hypothetical protein
VFFSASVSTQLLSSIFSSNMDPLVFAAAGINVNSSSPNTNVNASSAVIAAIIPLSNTQQVINLKLTNTNYLFWCMQIKSYLIGRGVFSFVDGSHSCPSPHDLSSDPSANSASFSFGPSQAFLTWKQQDQLILSSLLSSFSIDVLHLVVDFPTSASVWSTLELLLPLNPTLRLCNCMTLFKTFVKVMILSLSTCRKLRDYLIN